MSECLMRHCRVLSFLSAKSKKLGATPVQSSRPYEFREPAAAEIYQLIAAATSRSDFQLAWDSLLEQTVIDWGISVRERLKDQIVYVNGRLVSGLNAKVKFSEDLKSTLTAISQRYNNIGELLLTAGVTTAPIISPAEVDAYLRLASDGITFVRSGAPEYQGNIPELFYLRAFKVALLLSVASIGPKSRQMTAASGIGFMYALCAFVQRAAVRKALRALAPSTPARPLCRVVQA